jgi:hypothetical protein
MAFDSSQVLRDMAAAAESVISGDWPKVQDCVKQALKDQEEALQDIAEARLKKELTDDELHSQLEDEKATLEAALLACRVRAKAMAQEAANAAIQVLEKAIKAAL